MQLAKYLPTFIASTKEFKALFDVLDPQVLKLFEISDNTLNDLFVLGCSEYATKKYEKIVGIVPKLTDSLEKRQLDILAIYNEVPPFTFEILVEMLTSLLGENNFNAILDIPNYSLKIILRRDKINYIDSVNDMLERIVPVNIIINYKIDLNTWKDLTRFKWTDLKGSTWEQARTDERFNGFNDLE